MNSSLAPRIEAELAALPVPVAVALPDGQRIEPAGARLRLAFSRWSSVAKLAARQIGSVAEDYVEGRVQIEGAMRDLMQAAAALMPGQPVQTQTGWWSRLLRNAKSRGAHTRQKDSEQIQFHYDVSDDFYALWLDPRRVYSCAYFREASLDLAGAQAAKLDHICRKLRLKPGERFLDIGCGWGALLLWAAEHYGVDATGITLSQNQHAHVQALIAERGLADRVRVHLMDYRELEGQQAFDKIASVGMFEHVGQAQMDGYFRGVQKLLVPGGLTLQHGITAGVLAHQQLGAGMGDFIEKYIFPGGELLHVSSVLQHIAGAGLEMVDTENLRPHYARTLWAWSDALEAQLEKARAVLEKTAGPERGERILRAYRLYLSGCAMSFEQGWISLHQMLCARPDGQIQAHAMRGAQTDYPFTRNYIYN
ncbi:cyclopropane-fatty-acyl-phospholipid synthase family protein [Xenophilus sp. Marseille-Q4582]|uniref:SAM-dependent methyltransferase n=1 Tax=Xenophilus sp. Marseille-Q4582 TaxID=2866600 RepID=UPI001CE3C3DB|nr:cyclopropane-fatty-acyl-phospholipid synthase family protein [Xenophilus sp. Marseille-Q4582]